MRPFRFFTPRIQRLSWIDSLSRPTDNVRDREIARVRKDSAVGQTRSLQKCDNSFPGTKCEIFVHLLSIHLISAFQR